jgi:hypothetical protein
MDYVHDVAEVVFADLEQRQEYVERARVGEKVGRVSADHDYAGLGRNVEGRTRSCPVGTSEFPQSRSKTGRDTPYPRRGDLYSSRRRVRDAVKVLRRRRGAVGDVSSAEKVSMMNSNAIRLPRSQAWE